MIPVPYVDGDSSESLITLEEWAKRGGLAWAGGMMLLAEEEFAFEYAKDV